MVKLDVLVPRRDRGSLENDPDGLETGSDAFSPQAPDASLGHLKVCSPSLLPAGGPART